MLTLLTLCDWLTRRDLTPLAVELVTPAPADDTRHRAAFGVPPRFGQPVNRFLMAEADLLQPIPTHNPSLWALHEQLVEAELGQLGSLGQSLVSAKVRTEISRMLHLGEPRREDVASLEHRIALPAWATESCPWLPPHETTADTGALRLVS